MSRPSLVWILLLVVLVALGVTVRQVLVGPDEATARNPATTDPGDRVKLSTSPTGDDSSTPPGDATLNEDGLLKTLPVPQSPPAKLNARAKKRWQEDLRALIDDASYLEDEASLRMLIVEFRNPDPGIAAAARESLLSRADKKALPYLLEMQELDLNPDKKRQIEEMVGFLKKQSVFEHMRSKDL